MQTAFPHHAGLRISVFVILEHICTYQLIHNTLNIVIDIYDPSLCVKFTQATVKSYCDVEQLLLHIGKGRERVARRCIQWRGWRSRSGKSTFTEGRHTEWDNGGKRLSNTFRLFHPFGVWGPKDLGPAIQILQVIVSIALIRML